MRLPNFTTVQLKGAVSQLTTARKLLGKRWIKSRLLDGYGRVCSVGALNLAARRTQDNLGANLPSGQILACTINPNVDPVDAIIPFNDATETTKADVLKQFDKAIKVAKALLKKSR